MHCGKTIARGSYVKDDYTNFNYRRKKKTQANCCMFSNKNICVSSVPVSNMRQKITWTRNKLYKRNEVLGGDKKEGKEGRKETCDDRLSNFILKAPWIGGCLKSVGCLESEMRYKCWGLLHFCLMLNFNLMPKLR